MGNLGDSAFLHSAILTQADMKLMKTHQRSIGHILGIRVENSVEDTVGDDEPE